MNRERWAATIERWVRSNEQEAISLVQRLVQIPSVNHPPHGNELTYQQFFAYWMREAGAEVELYNLSDVAGLTEHPAYMAGRRYEGRPNVIGRFPGIGNGGRSLLFSGHADTVYEGNEPWIYPPFAGSVADGKLYGRGAYDMKGGMAAALMAVRCVRELGIPLCGDVFVESVVDEEHGGANGTLAARLRGPAADIAIVPEPSNMELYTAHLGGGIWRASFEGKSGIGFAGEELVSALDASIAFARLLHDFSVHYNAAHPPSAPWDAGKTANVTITRIMSGDPKRELLEKVPASGEVQFWIEGFPGMTGDRIMKELSDFMKLKEEQFPELRRCPPVIVPLIRYLQASEMRRDGESDRFLKLARQTGERILGRPLKEAGAPFACDGFMFNLYSETPALVLGPAGGNAHAADEFVDIDSFIRLICWYAELMIGWCGVGDQ